MVKQLSIEVVRSRQLRRIQTKEEHELWQLLRSRRLEGIKFRRQYVIGTFIVDFVSLKKKLIIEIDGRQHNKKTNKIYDISRTKFLESEGFKVLRFWNKEVLNNIEGVLEKIRISYE
jgi:very-short-patch-repair endonuclease